MHLNHPKTIPPLVRGKIILPQIGPWYQKGEDYYPKGVVVFFQSFVHQILIECPTSSEASNSVVNKREGRNTFPFEF